MRSGSTSRKKIALGEGAGLVGKFLPAQEADALLAQVREELMVPAVVLGGDELVNVGGEAVKGFVGTEAVEPGLAVAVFNALHEAGLADFDVLVEVGAGDGEELYAFQQGIGGVFRLFKDAAVELHPGVISSVEELLFWGGSGHHVRPVRRVGSLQGLPLGRHLEIRGEGENTLSGNSYRMQGVNSVKAERKGSERHEMGSGSVGLSDWTCPDAEGFQLTLLAEWRATYHRRKVVSRARRFAKLVAQT